MNWQTIVGHFKDFANDTITIPTTMLWGLGIYILSSIIDSYIIMAISIPFILIGIPKNTELRRKHE